METTLLGLALPGVLKEVKRLLKQQGFVVQMMPTANPIIVAHRKGSWFRKPRQLVLEIISVNKEQTRVDITAIVNNKNSSHAEGIIEESIAASIYKVFKKAITPSYGF
jgi:hypothetical protein